MVKECGRRKKYLRKMYIPIKWGKEGRRRSTIIGKREGKLKNIGK